MSEHYSLPHSPVGRPLKERWSRPLPALRDTRSEVVAFTDHNPASKPMLSLYDRLCAEAGQVLFGSAIMGGGLVLAARPDVMQDEDVVLIYFSPKNRRFTLSHRHRDVQPQQSEECAEGDVWERLRLYLAYKFGIRISKIKEEGEPVRPDNVG